MKPQFIGPDVWVFTSALYQTNSTVIRTKDAIIVVDPNWLPDEVDAIRTFVQIIRDHRKLYLLFTHSDYDHIIGYRAFDPDAVIASNAFANNPRKQKDVELAMQFDLSHFIIRDHPISYPDVDIVIGNDGQVLDLGDARLTFYLSPGHTAQGISTICEPYGIWIAGDYLSDIEFPLVQDSVEQYRVTLQKVDSILNTHQINFMIPGHGTVESSGSGILTRRQRAVEYLDDLEAHVALNIPFPEEKYMKQYAFWEGLRDWHLENVEFLRTKPAK